VKFSYKVAVEETPGILQKIDIQSNLDLLVASCDSNPWPSSL
jgi:hypothetical protein